MDQHEASASDSAIEHRSTPPTAPSRPRPILLSALVALAALAAFGINLGQEPHFVDESAYYSQSGYFDLLLNDRDQIAWLDYAGVDLPPLPKYLIGASLKAFGYPRPNPRTAWEWYGNTSRRFETLDSLNAARFPSVILGALGCVAIFWLGRTLIDARVGVIAAIFLMSNPLYRMLARRAMSDVPAEAFLLVALALGSAAWVRFLDRRQISRAWILSIAAGACVGLSVLSKLNGTISGLILAAWAALGIALLARRSKTEESRSITSTALSIFAATALAGATSFGLFVALNPFLTAQPKPPIERRLEEVAKKSFIERVAMVADHRIEASRSGQRSFPNDALLTASAKLQAAVIQGFGRFGLFGPAHSDSRIRIDPRQDLGYRIWGPLVLLGWIRTIFLGLKRLKANAVPTPWLLTVQAALAFFTVTLFIPLAWDRYYISMQPGSCLLAAVALVEFWDALRRGLSR